MTNALNPDLMTAKERLDEVARILAAGIARERLNHFENKGKTENFCLDKPPGKSVHVIEKTAERRMT